METYEICLGRPLCKKKKTKGMNELFTLQMDLIRVMDLISLWIPQIFC